MKAFQLQVTNPPKVSSSSSCVKEALRSITDCRWNLPMLMHNHSLNIVHFERSGLAVHIESGSQRRKKTSPLRL